MYAFSIYEGSEEGRRICETGFSIAPRVRDRWVHEGATYEFVNVQTSSASVVLVDPGSSVDALCAGLNRAIKNVVDAEDKVDAIESDLADARASLGCFIEDRDRIMARLAEAMRKARA